MGIDLDRLNTNFDLLSSDEHLDDLFQKIARPHNDYLIVMRGAPSAAKVLDRLDLLNRVSEALQASQGDDDEFRRLLAELRGRPPTVIGGQPGKQERVREDSLAEIGAWLLRAATFKKLEIGRTVQHMIDSAPARQVLNVTAAAPSRRGIAVVTERGIPLGVIDAGRTGSKARAKAPRPVPLPAAAKALPAAPPEPFHAHPRLAVDRPLRAGKEFQLLVGFSDTADADADFTTPIDIADPQVGEIMDVLITVGGADLSDGWKVELPLDLNAQRTVAATVRADATEVKLSANYLFRGRPVGTISKTIPVETNPAAAKTSATATIPSWVPALGTAESIAAVDAILLVHLQPPAAIEWKAYVPKTGKSWGPLAVALGDASGFAKKLTDIAKTGRDLKGDRALPVVDVGQTIADLIPPAIIDEVLTPQLAQNRTPTLLLFTDEPFVPWELARLSPAQAARKKPAFLGEVACIGRWWLRANSSGPASSASIRHLSAVAASEYDEGVNQTPLDHAIAERKLLVDKYLAEEVEARAKPMASWLRRKPQAGHLAHIALHGYNDPASQAEGLILGDGTNLTPIDLSGEWNRGKIPRFSMVFLNACQVGTAGSRLGQMSGFPGVLIRNGIGAFVAPLWEVDDDVATQVAEQFYDGALDQGKNVGEVLRSIRAGKSKSKSITPLAYLYYGHPALRLARTPAGG